MTRTGQYAHRDLGELLAPTLAPLTPRSVFVDDEEAADRRPAKATSAGLIPVGRTDATGSPRATVDYARRVMIAALGDCVLSIGADSADSSELRFHKPLLVGIALFILPIGFLWGCLYWVVGEEAVALTPCAYVAGSIISLAVFARNQEAAGAPVRAGGRVHLALSRLITRQKGCGMKIVSAREGVISISSSMTNAFIDFSTMDSSILALVSDVVIDGEPVVGYGFNSNGRYSAGEILRRRILPRLMDASANSLLDEDGELSPSKAWDVMMRNEKPGGHGERSVAVGVVDMALHDLAAKVAGVPLYRWISDKYGDGNPDDSVFVYAAGGYYLPGKTYRDLQDEMKGFLDAGYKVVKMKIGGADLAEDLRRIEAVLEVLDGDGSRLAVDANGRFDLETALEYGNALDPYGLFWFEEIGDPLDYHLNATLSERYLGPIATGENLFSLQDARNLIRYGGMRPDRDYIQVDPALSYGLVEYRRIQQMLAQHGWSSRRCIPHGGHQFSLHIAAALKLGGNESYPGEFQPTGGFADDALVEDSRVKLDHRPGIGFEGKADLYKVLRELHA